MLLDGAVKTPPVLKSIFQGKKGLQLLLHTYFLYKNSHSVLGVNMQLLMSSIAFDLQKQAYLCFEFADNHKPFLYNLYQHIGNDLKASI